MNIQDTLTVRGKSNKGKNRVRECGDTWVVVAKGNPACLDKKAGVRLLALSGQTRWMAIEDDRDFEVISITPYTL
jgi:hypothetical protein